jgi:restriction system protein
VPETALELLKIATEGDYQTPTCPACSVKMISRKSTSQGRKYWGCRNYPACKHTFFELG